MVSLKGGGDVRLRSSWKGEGEGTVRGHTTQLVHTRRKGQRVEEYKAHLKLLMKMSALLGRT